MPPPYRITDAAQAILDVAAQLFVDDGAPFERVSLSPGPPSGTWCNQLTVHVSPMTDAIFETQQSSRSINKSHRPTPTIIVTTMRCVTALTSDGVPSEAVVQAEGQRHLRDLDVLWYGLGQAIASGGDAPFGCTSAMLAAATPLRPDSLGGWQVPIQVTL